MSNTYSIPESEIPESEISDTPSKDLTDKVKALKSLSTIHRLLLEGMFQHIQYTALSDSIAFIESLHSNLAQSALNDPQADMIPELQVLKSIPKGN